MQHSSRLFIGALLSTVGLLGARVTPASAFDQTSVSSAVVDSSTRVQVEGTLVVFAGGDGVQGTVAGMPLADEVRLVTPAGDSIVLTGALSENVTTGSEFDGTVTVPTDAISEVNAVVEDALGEAAPLVAANTVDAESAVGGEILAASEMLEAPLVVVEATITPEAIEAGQVATAHTLDVVVVTLPTAPAESVMSNLAIDTLTTTLDTYWESQSAGQVASISRPAAIQRFVSANACNQNAVWAEAAEKFGHDSSWYWRDSAASHLIVIAPEACAANPAGLGTIDSPQAGGLVWVRSFAPIAAVTFAHEFGHNLGLQHSHASECTDNTVEGGACADKEYYDFYDVMGGGLHYALPTGGFRANEQLMALNVTHKSRLGALTTSELPSVDLAVGIPSSSSDFTLMPASAASGLRGLKVTDPRTGEAYFVEYRSGTGIDAGSLYSSGLDPKLGLGVRILRLRIDGASAALTRPNALDQSKRPLFMKATQSFVSASGGLIITVTGVGASAAVTVDLVATLPKLTATPVPTVSGTAKVNYTLTANPGIWGPGAVTLGHQWYRSGVLIVGATANTYKLSAADLGKYMTVRVTGVQAGYASASKTSAATAAVAAGTLTTVTPTIAGTKKVGYTLTANPGTWGPATVTLSYKWYRSGILITGATAKTYKLAAADLGKAMSVLVTGAKAGYASAGKTSARTTAVVRGTLVTPTPTISGTKRAGYTLTANPGTWGPAPVTLTYRWYRSGVAITGATGKTYRLVSADRYDTIKVKVTGVKSGYTSVAKYSASTVKIP